MKFFALVTILNLAVSLPVFDLFKSRQKAAASKDKSRGILPEQQAVRENIIALRSRERMITISFGAEERKAATPAAKQAIEQRKNAFVKDMDARVDAELTKLVQLDIAHFGSVSRETINMQTAIHGFDPMPIRDRNGDVVHQQAPLDPFADIDWADFHHQIISLNQEHSSHQMIDPSIDIENHAGFDASSQQSVVGSTTNQAHGIASEHSIPEHSAPLTAHE